MITFFSNILQHAVQFPLLSYLHDSRVPRTAHTACNRQTRYSVFTTCPNMSR